MPIIQKLAVVYKLWQEYLRHFHKDSRYTLGLKIDSLLIEIIEFTLTANYSSKEQKRIILQKAINKLDLLKFFTQLAWEIKSLDNKKYITLSEILNEIGRMLGGWNKKIK